MANSSPTALIILSELVFILSMLLIGIGGFIIYQKKKGATLLKQVSQRIADKKAERQNALKQHFSGIPQTSEDHIDAVTNEIVSNENEFYKTIINAFVKNDLDCMEKIDAEVGKLVAPYKKLVPDGTAAPEATNSDDAIIPDIDDAIDELISDDNSDDNADASDPALDLSGEENDPDTGIAELPEDLLSDPDADTDK